MGARTSYTLSSEAREVLTASVFDATTKIWRLPARQLERKLYVEVNRALEAAGGKWSRKDKGHVFDHDPREQLGVIVDTGEVVRHQVVLQQYWTPPNLAKLLVRAAGVRNGHLVLEPSAGHGALVEAVKSAAPRAKVHAIDTDPACGEVLMEQKLADVVHVTDFLTVSPYEVDRVVMNPPFTRGQDIEHVTHALKFLKPGGVLVAIVSPMALAGSTRKHEEFREALRRYRKNTWPVPAGVFKGSGTGVMTSMIRLGLEG